MGENQSKPLPPKELSAEEIRRQRLAKLGHKQTQDDAEERKVAPRDQKMTNPKPQNITQKPSVESPSPKKESAQPTNPVMTPFDKDPSSEDVRRLRLKKLEQEQAQREAEERKLAPQEEKSIDPKPQNVNEKSSLQSQSPEKEKEQKIAQHISPQAQETQEIKSEPTEVKIASSSTFEKPKIVEVLPEYILDHPIYQTSGKEAYIVHSYFEDVYKGTTEIISFRKKFGLKYYKDLEEKQFTIENFDGVLQSILENPKYYPSDLKVEFLLNVYQRLGNVELTGVVTDVKRNVFRRTAISYLKSYLETPAIFGSDRIAAENCKDIFEIKSPLCEALYSYFTDDDKQRLIIDMAKSLEETDFSTILTPLLKRIVRDCREYSLLNIKKQSSAILLLEAMIFADKRIIEFFVTHPLYSLGDMQKKTAVQFQRLTIFGSCLSLATLPQESPATKNFWFENDHLDLQRHEEIVDDLRGKIHSTIDSVYRIMEHMMKVDKKYKKSVVDWLYEVLELNDAKQMTHNLGTIFSTTGWFTNFLVLLFKFCQKPLEDLNKYPNWLAKIDVNYIAERSIFKDVSLLNGRGNNYLKKSEGEFSFLTELIYLTTHALILHKSANQQFIVFLKKMVKMSRGQGRSSKDFINAFKARLGFDVQLMDPYLHNQILKLLTFDALFTIHAFDVSVKDMKDLEKPFESTQLIKGDDFQARATIPIYWVENIEEYLLFFWQLDPSLLTKNQANFKILANFMLSLFSNPHWIKNPHLKGKCIDFLSTLLPRENDLIQGKKVEDFSWLFKQNPFYERHLIFGLIQFFVEAEKSGYFEKYNYRQSAAMIINYLLRTVFPYGKTSYVADCLDRMAKEHYDLYLKFIMLYLNDIIHFLDEVFKNLREMKIYEGDLEQGNLASLPPETQNERSMYYETNLRSSQIFSMYLKTFYQMGAAITKVSPDFFMTDEIREKFIVNLNYILDGLNGENAMSLKVKFLKLLEFDPKFLLETVVQIYLNFSDKEEFIKGVSQDERSFKIELFHKTVHIMKKYNILGAEDLEKFQELIKKLEVKAQEKKQEDDFMAKLTDIPDEFMDPIMGEVMKDPVRLPSSQVVVDRLTIQKHLLSDDTDPFNRSKLTKEMLEPQPDLKQKIEEFFAEKRRNFVKE